MLQISETKLSGTVRYGQDLNFKVKVHNPSDQNIVLSASTSCGSCTKAVVSPNPIAANSDGDIDIKYMSRQGGLGDVTKSVSLNWFLNGVNYSEKIILKIHVSRS